MKVIELSSSSDDLEMLAEEMLAGVDVEVRSLPTELSGESLLLGFKLSLSGYLWIVEILMKVKSILYKNGALTKCNAP